MVSDNVFLAGHILIILTGVYIASPWSKGLASEEGFGRLFNSTRDRMLTGLLVVILGGFTVSTHTWWYHNKYHEIGGDISCSAFGSFSCGDVLANAEYNTVPVLGMPWGLVGMLAFAALGFLALSVRKEPNAKWASTYIDVGYVLSGFGILIALYLLYVEIVPLKMTFCQFCSVAHIADIIVFVMFLNLRKLNKTDEWDPEGALLAKSEKEKELRKSSKKSGGGFVKPTRRAGDEEE